MGKRGYYRRMSWQEFFNVEYLGEVTSTNALLKEGARLGDIEGKVLVARSQTAGRGRKERRFYSSGRGLYTSILLRPSRVTANASWRFTVLAAVAVSRALRSLGFLPKIKWVNDVYLGAKKVAGILAEGSVNSEGNLDYVVIGIGVNVAPPEGGFPDEIKDIATALYKNYSEEKRRCLLDKILSEIYDLYVNACFKDVIEEYRSASILIGREVTVTEGRYQGNATVLGIDDECRLVVDTGQGRMVMDSGEVRIKL